MRVHTNTVRPGAVASAHVGAVGVHRVGLAALAFLQLWSWVFYFALLRGPKVQWVVTLTDPFRRTRSSVITVLSGLGLTLTLHKSEESEETK